jgi:ketosteroid isomerase-like protein
VGEAEMDVIRDQYAAVNERDWERAMSHYAEDVELVVPGSGLQSGTVTGKRAVGDWFGDWMATFDYDLHFEITELMELRDGSLLVLADHRARGRGSGVELEEPIAWRYWLRGGKIVKVFGGWGWVEEARKLAEEERAPD